MHGGNVELLASRYGLAVPEVLDFSANVNPFGHPGDLKEVLDESLKEISRYPDPACTKLKEALAEYHGVGPECIAVGNGASELIFWAARLHSEPDALVFAPAFTEYAAAVQSAGGSVRYLIAQEKDQFHHRFEDMAVDLWNDFDLVFIGNPNNPTGTLSAGPLRDWVREASQENDDTVFVIDESFLPFVEQEERISLARWAAQKQDLIVLRSLTKIFSIPGLRLGYVVAHPGLIARLERIMPTWRVNTLAQKFGQRVLRYSQFLTDSVLSLQTVRDRLLADLSRIPGLQVFDGAANFLLVKLLRASASDLADALAQRGLLVRVCNDFVGLERDRFIRIAVRRSADNERLLQALREQMIRG